MLAPVLKLCKKCDTEKPLSEFHNKTRGKLGKASHCKMCSATINAIYREQNKSSIKQKIQTWHARNPEKKFEYHKKKYERPKGRAMHLFNSARKRKPDNFTLTLAHVTREIERGCCAATRISFDFHLNHNGKDGRLRSPFSPSLDKIDPTKPYTNENTRVVIWQYNAMKGELSDADLLEICRRVVTNAA